MNMKWYQVNARYNQVQENGKTKKVTEQYLVQSASFGEAERIIYEEISQFAESEFDITAVVRKNYSEIITDKYDLVSYAEGTACKIFGQKNVSTKADKWFKCKLNLISLDEKSGKEKKNARYYLVNANTALSAHKIMDNHMHGSISDYKIEQVDETNIIKVFIQSDDK